MRILFAVSNDENSKDDIVNVIVNEYQKTYKKIVSYKRAFYYEAIVNEIKETRDENRYDLIIISEDLEKNIKESYDNQDDNLFRRLDEITDEAYKEDGTSIPIILICSDRRSEGDPIIQQLFVLGVYNVLVGRDRTIQNVCALINKPRNKKEAKLMYGILPKKLTYKARANKSTISQRELMSIIKFFSINQDNVDKCVRGFSKIYKEYTEEQLQIIINNLPLSVRIKLEENSKEYVSVAKESVKQYQEKNSNSTLKEVILTNNTGVSSGVIIPGQDRKKGIFKRSNGKNE